MIVDLRFPLLAEAIAADHGYLLYTGLTTVLPELHERTDYGIHPVRGRLAPDRRLLLNRSSTLTVRVDHSALSVLVPLAGRRLRIGRDTVAIGLPSTCALRPAPTLVSRLIVIKGFREAEAFAEAARRQLDQLGLAGRLDLSEPTGTVRVEHRTAPRPGPVRRTLRIRDREVVGFAVTVSGLTAADSLALQSQGLGGRRRFGCGIFLPVDGR